VRTRAERDDLAACHALLRGGSRSFLIASHLLPREVRHAAVALYAFCRTADDAIDQANGGQAALAALRERIVRACAGRPLPDPADRAFAAVAARCAIPPELPLALLEGLAWDVAGRRYASLDALTDYAVRVAGTVGMMMALVMGARTPEALARACDLGVAMQFSNIARDVGEDARAGRLYLPLDWLQAAGIDPDSWLACPVFCGGIGDAVARLLVAAARLYQRADAGLAMLPLAVRPGIRAARLLYAEIGAEVARRGCDSVSGRAVVSPARKLRVLARTLGATPNSDDAAAPSLSGARYLLDAVGATAMPPVPTRRHALSEKAVFVIELFARLAEREALRAEQA
jgi:phytoene synthase